MRPVLLAAMLAVPTLAFAQVGRVTGVVRDETGAVLALAEIRALSIQGRDTVVAARTMTDATGSFTLNLPGEVSAFTVIVRRLGYRPVVAPTPTAGTGMAIDVSLQALPRVIATVTVRGSRCVDNLYTSTNPAAQLWRQALEAADIRQTVLRQYTWRVEYRMTRRHGDISVAPWLDTLIVGDDANQSISPTPMRRPNPTYFGSASRSKTRIMWGGVDNVFDPGFLTEYCPYEGVFDEGADLVGVGFGPRRPDRKRVQVQGEVLFDGAKGTPRSLRYRFYAGDRLLGEASVGIAEHKIEGAGFPLDVEQMGEIIDPRSGKVGERFDGRITLTNFRRR